MLYIICVLFITLIIGIIVKREEIFGLSIVALILPLFTSAISYTEHYHDLGNIRAGHYMVEVYKERRVELTDMIKQLTPNTKQENPILVNHDTPQASLFAELSSVSKDISRAKRRIAGAKIDIAQRKAGMFSFIVDWMGEK